MLALCESDEATSWQPSVRPDPWLSLKHQSKYFHVYNGIRKLNGFLYTVADRSIPRDYVYMHDIGGLCFLETLVMTSLKTKT